MSSNSDVDATGALRNRRRATYWMAGLCILAAFSVAASVGMDYALWKQAGALIGFAGSLALVTVHRYRPEVLEL